MRLLTCAGGTGGGIYPALAVLQKLEASQHTHLWVGSEGSMEADLVSRAGIPYREIPAAGLHGVGLKALPGNALRLTKGVFAARKIIREFQPDAIFFTGGYVAAPVAVAGRNLPILLYIPDIEPGYALKFVSRFADKIAVTVGDSIPFLPERPKKVISGYPLHSMQAPLQKAVARQQFGLDPQLSTLLVFGGSLGARSINAALVHHLPALTARYNVLHVTGSKNIDDVDKLLGEMTLSQPERYKHFAYLHDEMHAALSAADLVVSRAGASILGEYPFYGLPSVLVPYPHAWTYQRTNAGYLQSRDAAVIVDNQDLGSQLFETVTMLLENPEKLHSMRDALLTMRKTDAAETIAAELVQMAGQAQKESSR